MLIDAISHLIRLSDIEISCNECMREGGAHAVTHAYITDDNVLVCHCLECAISLGFKNIFSVQSMDFNCHEICDYDGCDGDFITTHVGLKCDMRLVILCEVVLDREHVCDIPIAIPMREYKYNKNNP